MQVPQNGQPIGACLLTMLPAWRSHAALTYASSLEFPAERMEPATLAARTGSLSRWLKVHLFEYTRHQVSHLEEQVIAQDIFSDKTQTRGLGFYFDQIIAHALLGACGSKKKVCTIQRRKQKNSQLEAICWICLPS